MKRTAEWRVAFVSFGSIPPCPSTGAEFIRKGIWLALGRAGLLLAAGFVGWSRVDAKKHYGHDVLAGAALGVLANHDFWLRRDAGATVRLSATTLESGRALAPGLVITWSR